MYKWEHEMGLIKQKYISHGSNLFKSNIFLIFLIDYDKNWLNEFSSYKSDYITAI